MSSSSSPPTPLVIGRYAIFDEIASGGMATVFLARFLGPAGFARTVAVKRLHPQFAKEPEFVTMLLDEARLAARIRHPNVVGTLDVVVKKDEVFLAMDYVQGESLSRLERASQRREEPVPTAVALRIATDVLQGLHAAHEAHDERGMPLNLVHRDVSPQNILVGVDGIARLVDFGVAKAAGRMHTTQEGEIKGKLAYMAPEQLDGRGVTRQTDLYAFAVVLWELVTGSRLFMGDNQLDIVAKVLRHEITPPRQLAPWISPALDALIMRGLEVDPARRFATAREMCVALASCGPPASALDAGDWVTSLAGQELEARAVKVARIENSPIETLLGLGPPPMGSLLPHAPAGVGPPTVPTAIAIAARASVQRGDIANAEPVTEVGTATELTTGTEVVRRAGRRKVWLGTSIGVFAVAAVFGLLSWQYRETSRPAAAAASVPPPQVTAHVAPPTPAPSTTSATPEAVASAAPSATEAPTRPQALRRTVTVPHANAATKPASSRDTIYGSRE